jgi:hypothetical protein
MTDPIDCPNPTHTQVFGAKEQLTRFFNNGGVHFHTAKPHYQPFSDGPLLVEFCLCSSAQADQPPEVPSSLPSSRHEIIRPQQLDPRS